MVTSAAEETSFPEPARTLVSGLGIFNLDFLSYVPAECVYRESSFYTKLLIKTVGPLIIVAGLWAQPLIEAIARRPGVQGSANLAVVRMSIFLELIVPSISTTISDTLYCSCFDNGSFLRAQMTISCEDATWRSWAAYAGCCIVIFPIGVPFLLFYDVFIHRKEINKVMESLAVRRQKGDMSATVARIADSMVPTIMTALQATQVKALSSKFEVRSARRAGCVVFRLRVLTTNCDAVT